MPACSQLVLVRVAGGFFNAVGVGERAKLPLAGKSFAGGQKPAFSVPSQHCPGGKRRAKLLPLKSRRAKNEGLRDVPTADKGAEERGGSEELAPKLPAGLPWILC